MSAWIRSAHVLASTQTIYLIMVQVSQQEQGLFVQSSSGCFVLEIIKRPALLILCIPESVLEVIAV